MTILFCKESPGEMDNGNREKEKQGPLPHIFAFDVKEGAKYYLA
jgi:hypothetical protein